MHGLTFDGQHVWFASGDKLNALDPASGKTVRAIDVLAMRERPSTASICFRSPRTASIRSIRRLAACSPRSRRPATAAIRALPGPKGHSGSAASRPQDPSDRSRNRSDPSHHRVEPLRHRRHLGRRRTLAWHLGRRRERSAPHRPQTGEVLERLEMPAGARVGAGVGRRRPVLLWRREQRQGEAFAGLEGDELSGRGFPPIPGVSGNPAGCGQTCRRRWVPPPSRGLVDAGKRIQFDRIRGSDKDGASTSLSPHAAYLDARLARR